MEGQCRMRLHEFNITEAVDTYYIKQLQSDLKAAGADLGRFGPKGDGIDGKIGPLTQRAMLKFPKIAAEYKKIVNAASARKEFGVSDPRIKTGQNPNIDNTTRDKARSTVQQRVNQGGDDILPIDNPVVTSPFGRRTRNGIEGGHNGVDFRAAIGTSIVAPAAGKIERIHSEDTGKGGMYIVLDANGVVHKFFHLSDIMVEKGEMVDKGQVIGLSGDTGDVSGPHLHWEKHVAGQPIDPMTNRG